MILRDDNALRILIAGLTLMSCCAGLLGVIVGWKLRGKEVDRLTEKVEYLRGELTKVWGREVKKTKPERPMVRLEGQRIDKALAGREVGDRPHTHSYSMATGQCMFCTAMNPERECGEVHPEDSSLKCSKPKGHYKGPSTPGEGSKHGYAGVFWG